MAVLGIDPASESIGWAIVSECGRKVRQHGALTRPSGWPSWLRVRSLSPEIDRLLCESMEASVCRVIVEVPGSKHAGWTRGSYATPGVYAVAVGVVLALAWRRFPRSVVTVESDFWTRAVSGSTKKADRQALFAREHHIDLSVRGAGDAVDAAHMAVWWAIRYGFDKDPPSHLPACTMSRGRVYRESALEQTEGGTWTPRGSRVS